MRNLFVFLLALTFAAPLLVAADKPNTNNVDARRKQLDTLLKEQWEYTLRTAPEFASILGDKRYNDKLSDFSQEAIEEDLRQTKIFLDKFNAIDTTGFPEQEQLNKRLMVRDLKEALDNAKYKNWEMPVSQFIGLHLQAPQIVQLLPFDTVKDYEDYIARLKQFPKAFGDVEMQMRNGMRDKLMPPKYLLGKVADTPSSPPSCATTTRRTAASMKASGRYPRVTSATARSSSSAPPRT